MVGNPFPDQNDMVKEHPGLLTGLTDDQIMLKPGDGKEDGGIGEGQHQADDQHELVLQFHGRSRIGCWVAMSMHRLFLAGQIGGAPGRKIAAAAGTGNSLQRLPAGNVPCQDAYKRKKLLTKLRLFGHALAEENMVD